MKINWTVRIKNRDFWISMVPAILVLVNRVLILFGIEWSYEVLNENIVNIIESVFLVLALTGIVNDPTTATLKDSTQAMEYTEPKVSE